MKVTGYSETADFASCSSGVTGLGRRSVDGELVELGVFLFEGVMRELGIVLLCEVFKSVGVNQLVVKEEEDFIFICSV